MAVGFVVLLFLDVRISLFSTFEDVYSSDQKSFMDEHLRMIRVAVLCGSTLLICVALKVLRSAYWEKFQYSSEFEEKKRHFRRAELATISILLVFVVGQ